MDIALVLLVVLVIIFTQCGNRREGFSAFGKEEIDKKVEILMKEKNMKLFVPEGDYADAATEIDWVDPVTYYDLAKLHYDDAYTTENVRRLFEE